MRPLAKSAITILAILAIVASFVLLKIALRPGTATSSQSLVSQQQQIAPEAKPHRLAPSTSTSMLSELTSTRRSLAVFQDDPSQDGWDTEEFARLTDRQLSKIRALIERADTGQEDRLPDLVTEGFHCDSLRPKSRRTIFADRSLTVTQADVSESTASPATDDVLGVEGLRAALHEFTAPLTTAINLHAKFKTIRVNQEIGSTTTTVLVNTSGTTSSGSVQQNASWLCRWDIPEKGKLPRLMSIDTVEYVEAAATTPAQTLMTDCTEAMLGSNRCFEDQLAVGLPTWLDRIDANVAIATSGASGLAIGDVNGDGLDDVYVCQPAGLPNRLFIQQNDGTVLESAARRGVDWLDTSHSALLVDLDNDQDQDLALSLGKKVVLFSNDGSGHFTQRFVLQLSRLVYSLTAADYDLDGKVDIFACVYFSHNSDPGQLPDPLPYYDARNGGRNGLWRNEITAGGVWGFRNVTEQAGLDQNNDRWSFAAAWEDYDNDGDMDLYVANDFGRNNLYRNDRQSDGTVRFTDVAAQAGVEDGSFGMSVTWADHDRDGRMDLYVSNMFSAAGNRITYQRQFKPDVDQAMRQKYQYMARGNSLFRGRPDGTFEDVSMKSGATMGRWAWASKFIDINNDGWEDILVTNGNLTNELQDDL